ncbi:hypothetical protein NBO_823gi001 [Nosema bombycis CQ1]|uniref:Uncharacterized protein n=1 Tax=Nosema bombycis (strain CQ1 / CVCC 102059) TaxID=578461 RepID=R0KMB5_NOSB1|nr:hypothetical protein NBO_823gi001 [Nosema bombycis CQ1]|eukprot:EOB11791.1 hypothetical protein NBO_823gi001 [Nosema bombycis CQ1]
MTKLRLPLDSTSDKDQETIDSTQIKQYTKEFINNTFKELKETISSYHSVKEIESRKKLVAFYKQKICDFELFDLLLTGNECLGPLKIKIKNTENVENQCLLYEELANNLAIMFENLKQLISPSFDVKTAIQSYI